MRTPIPVLAVFVLAAACGSDTAGPDGPAPGGVDFGLPAGSAGAHHGEGMPSASGPVLQDPFAIALPDSVGGLAILSHDPAADGRSDLFVLQLQEIGTGTFECGPAGPCHGRLLVGVPTDGSGLPESVLEIRSGTLTLSMVGPARVRGTLQAVLEPPAGRPGATLVIEDGTIDVPLANDTFTSGAIDCLRAWTGGDPLPSGCR